MKEGIYIIVFFLLIGVFTAIGIGSIKHGKECDTTVVLVDGTTLKVSETITWKNGITDIISCKGEKIQVPTARIKVIR